MDEPISGWRGRVMSLAIVTKDIVKKYDGQNVLDKVSLSVFEGDIYGLVGRNGAGKTTFMKIVCGLSSPTSGSMSILGADPLTKGSESFSKIGSLIETPCFFPYMNATDNLMLKCICCGIDAPDKHIKELLELVGLQNVRNKHTRDFSLGMRQRLGLAMALIGNPELLVLDEPINGLDPQGIAEIRSLILKINRETGTTIVISSHILSELSKVATRYGILDCGKLVYENSREALEAECENKDMSFEDFYFQITQGDGR